MLEFVRNNFRKVFEFSLVLTVILVTISGSIVGYTISRNIIGVILGGGIGLLFGLLSVIIYGGLIATFLKIDENVNFLVSDINSMKYKTNDIKDTIDNYFKNTKNDNQKLPENSQNNIQDINNCNGKIIEKTYLYEENNYISKKLKELCIGEIIKIISTNNSWYYTENNEKIKGFVFSKSVEIL